MAKREGVCIVARGAGITIRQGRFRVNPYAYPYNPNQVVIKQSTNQYPSLYPARSATPGQT
jgi:hypothetical protein